MPIKDITGNKYGYLTAIKFIQRLQTSHKCLWLFKCDCGTEKEIDCYRVKAGTTKSCGCALGKFKFRRKDLTGKRFNYLVVIRPTRQNENQEWLWEALCDCGKTIEVVGSVLSRRRMTCGCSIDRKGEKSSWWKNGRGKTQQGYVWVYAPTHPNRGKNNTILEHRIVMEKIIGRYLLPNENVHHMNGVRDDNRPENLELWVKAQPCGQRPKDLVEFAKKILDTYEDLVSE